MAERQSVSRRTALWACVFVFPALVAVAIIVAFEDVNLGRIFAALCVAVALAAVAGSVVVGRLERLRSFLASDDRTDGATEAPRGGMFGSLSAAALRSREEVGGRLEHLERRAVGGERVFENLAVPIVIVDRDERVLSANRAARDIVGDEIADRPLSSCLRDPDVLDAVEQVLAGVEGADVELSIVGPLTRHFLAQILPVPGSAGDGGPAVVIALQDLTVAKRIDQTRADFIANVSHELRTPLSALIGFIETLNGPARDDTAARERFLVLMHEQAERMSRLIDDLMSLSRIELHEHARPAGRVNVVAAAQAAAEVMQIKATNKDIVLRLDISEEPSDVVGDADEVTQVLQNLIDNAVKYSRKGSTVTIAVDQETAAMGGVDQVVLAVSDEGEGIEAEHLPRLTERFYRVDPARSRSLGGTGLGLAIVKHIVNRHGGGLEIESTLGTGSTFKVTLPGAPRGSGDGVKKP